MNIKTYFSEKLLPNLVLWVVIYAVVGKLILPLLGYQPVAWRSMLNVKDLLTILFGSLVAIALGWILFQKAAAWFLSKMREEAANALINFSSILALVAVNDLRTGFAVAALVGYFVAWRLL